MTGAAEAAEPAGRTIRRIDNLLKHSPDQRLHILATITEEDCERILCDWNLCARPDQKSSPADSVVWLILAGRGAGKTSTGAEAVPR
ncbi:MAG TPA: hypothetical protein VEH77_08190 [Roseiarcus sp.]|nr:hypothetical protein [Roseiarcus sp.]